MLHAVCNEHTDVLEGLIFPKLQIELAFYREEKRNSEPSNTGWMFTDLVVGYFRDTFRTDQSGPTSLVRLLGEQVHKPGSPSPRNKERELEGWGVDRNHLPLPRAV
jgi:hypothetical protein